MPGTKSKQSKLTGFESFRLRPELMRAVRDAGYTAPRPIQAKALPAAMSGRDVLGLAQTGTGKTAAFVLPILQQLMESRGPGPRALVVAPTRELAAQVQGEFDRLAAHTNITSTAIFGGVPVPRNLRALNKRPDVVVACPGRLLDLLSQKALRLDHVQVLVLDEADHMFDMGFLPDVRRILNALPERRQNLLFSATMPREVRGLADRVLFKPHVIELASTRPAETIEHALYMMGETQKIGALEHLLSQKEFDSAIVFMRTKRRVQRLAKRLDSRGRRSASLQGNMSQSQRERALEGFRKGHFNVLVATDIAARGLDIEGVSHVINFDVPNQPDAYTHRIGRTGRSERTGSAFTFVTPDDDSAVRSIEKRLGARIERRSGKELGLDGSFQRTESLSKPRGRSGAARSGGRPGGRPGSGSGSGFGSRSPGQGARPGAKPKRAGAKKSSGGASGRTNSKSWSPKPKPKGGGSPAGRRRRPSEGNSNWGAGI